MLKLENIRKKFGAFALSGISLEVPDGEYFVLLGRSGSGKTCLLELIAGLNTPDSGTVRIDGQNMTNSKIQDRPVGLVFQDFAIFPNMTVYGNIAYPLRSKGMKKDEIAGKVKSIAAEMDISILLSRYPQYLSSGELQRVALARTLVLSPRLLLLDEPMSSVDASLKDDIRKVLRRINRSGLTVIHVTHDYREAVSLAGRVGVIHAGTIVQEGTPESVFGRPASRFVARYAGIKNFFNVRLRKEGDDWKAIGDRNITFRVDGSGFTGGGLMIVRSENITINDNEPFPRADNCFRGVIREIFPSEYGMEITVDAGMLFVADLSFSDFRKLKGREASQVWISFPGEAAVVIDGSNDSETS
ncbi:MAG TPA: ABC transporter [Bacteroidales bacterium]|nr:ABC transporter [Bacteroidales bacterium]